jgi:hypothetical protein
MTPEIHGFFKVKFTRVGGHGYRPPTRVNFQKVPFPRAGSTSLSQVFALGRGTTGGGGLLFTQQVGF